MWGPNHVPSCPPVPLTGRTELALQSSQRLSRCSLDPTDPPVNTGWQDSQPLRAQAAEKLSLGAFEIGPDGELSGILAGQSCSTSERVKRARYGPAHATCVCSPPTSKVWSHPPWVLQSLEEKPGAVQVLATHLSLNGE